MNVARSAEELSDISFQLSQHMNGLRTQVDRLQNCNKFLDQERRKRCESRATQADLGSHTNPLRHVKQMDHTQPFSFQQPTRKLNWKRLRHLDVEQLADSGDAATAMQMFEDIAYGDVEQGSIYDLSEANLMKIIKVAQLQLQYMQYKLEEKVEAQQALEDDSLAIAAGLSSLDAPSFGDIHKGLGMLESDIRQLGQTRMTGLIEQVRLEERQAAKSALLQSEQQLPARQRMPLQEGV